VKLGDRIACPDDELLAAFAEARLDEAMGGAVERHVAECSSCLDVVAVCVPARGVAVAELPSPLPDTARVTSRRWRWALAASLVLVAGGLVLVAAEYPQHRLAMGLSRLASRWLAARVEIDGIAVRVGPSASLLVTLRDVRLGRDVFRAEAVEVTVGLAALASGDSALRSIRLVRPLVSVTSPESLAGAWSERGRARVLSALGDAERVDVVDGRVEVRGMAIAVEDVSGGLERGPATANVVLQGRVGTGRVDVDGDLGYCHTITIVDSPDRPTLVGETNEWVGK